MVCVQESHLRGNILTNSFPRNGLHVTILFHNQEKNMSNWEMKNTFILVGKLDGRNHLREAYVDGRIILKLIFKSCV
jgi:hypothetical protein